MKALRSWAFAVKRETLALYFAARDQRSPWYARLVAAAVVAYALSPIDLIPDFIPVLGQLDDLLLVPLGLALAMRLIPECVLDEARIRATTIAIRPTSRTGAVLVGVLWAVLTIAALYAIVVMVRR